MSAAARFEIARLTERPARSPVPLTIAGLSVSFGGVHALEAVDLEVRPGEVHGLIGPNGAGKTTLIDAATGFVRVSAGTVYLGAMDISRWPARRRAGGGVSRSFQSLELFDDMTILENIAVACEQPRRYRCMTDLLHPGPIKLSGAALEALREFGLLDVVNRMPSEISFGRRKTVAIARAMASSPSVLLLDEPAAGLDEHEAQELAVVITRIAHDWGVGVLLVEHKVDMIMSICDRVTVLQAGRILAAGRPAEVAAATEVLDAYLGTAVPV
jgi:sulfate-transporting ATPase